MPQDEFHTTDSQFQMYHKRLSVLFYYSQPNVPVVVVREKEQECECVVRAILVLIFFTHIQLLLWPHTRHDYYSVSLGLCFHCWARHCCRCECVYLASAEQLVQRRRKRREEKKKVYAFVLIFEMINVRMEYPMPMDKCSFVGYCIGVCVSVCSMNTHFSRAIVRIVWRGRNHFFCSL